MCDPATAMVVLTVASGAMEYQAASQVAKDQERSNEELSRLTQEALDNDVEALEEQRKEARKATAQELLNNKRAGQEQMAAALISASESGVAGLSVDAIIGDVQRQVGENDAIINQDFTSANKQINRQIDSAYITAQSRINQATPSQAPSLLGSVVKTGTKAFIASESVGGFKKKPVKSSVKTPK